jgi:hypothetical protein
VLAAEIVLAGPREVESAVPPIRLTRLEALWQDLRDAIAAGRATRRTLAGMLISVKSDGSLAITREHRRNTVSKRAAVALTNRRRGRADLRERR